MVRFAPETDVDVGHNAEKGPRAVAGPPHARLVEGGNCREKLGSPEKPELRERGNAIIETNFLDDLAVAESKHRGAG
jgi:hypothetical protein